MTKSTKVKNCVYKSFEQFRAELFPQSRDCAKAENRASQNVHDLAVCLAEISFNEVLRHSREA